jgi:hypothetical protein
MAEEKFGGKKEDNTGLIVVGVLLTLFLGIIGAVVAYFLLKDKEPKIAKILLVIGVVLLVIGIIMIAFIFGLFFLGLGNRPCAWVGTQVSGFSGFVIPSSSVKMSGTPNTLKFQLISNKIDTISISNITMSTSGGYYGVNAMIIADRLLPGENASITLQRTAGSDFSVGSCYSVNVAITYNVLGTEETKSGIIYGVVV